VTRSQAPKLTIFTFKQDLIRLDELDEDPRPARIINIKHAVRSKA
jgi:hypothetical protein